MRNVECFICEKSISKKELNDGYIIADEIVCKVCGQNLIKELA